MSIILAQKQLIPKPDLGYTHVFKRFI